MLRRVFRLLVKELLQIRRDRFALIGLCAFPIMELLIYAYAASFEVRNVTMAVLDRDHSQESREFLSHLVASGRFKITVIARDPGDIVRSIDSSNVGAALQINAGFAELLQKGRNAPVQVIFDGTDSNTALIARGYIEEIVAGLAGDRLRNRLNHLAPRLTPLLPEVRLAQRPWYNRDLRSRWFFVPGVIGAIALVEVLCLGPVLVVRERESGTLEQLIVTPLRPIEMLLGKAAPIFLIGLINVFLLVAIAIAWFRLPFSGSVSALLAGTVLFLFSTLGISLLLSTSSSTIQQAFAMGFFFVIPALALSGLIFPIASMPVALQWLTYVDPLRYFLVVLRDTFLKGSGIDLLWPQLFAMGLLSVVLFSASALAFRKSLD
jgi:ABC-2 type transport system permease protein